MTRSNKLINFFSVTDLEDGKDYHFQVLAMAFNDYQSGSEIVSVTIPGSQNFKAIALGLLSAIGFVAALLVAVYYIRKKWYRNYQDNKKVNN